jgi:hypothetical protein
MLRSPGGAHAGQRIVIVSPVLPSSRFTHPRPSQTAHGLSGL